MHLGYTHFGSECRLYSVHSRVILTLQMTKTEQLQLQIPQKIDNEFDLIQHMQSRLDRSWYKAEIRYKPAETQ